MKKIYLLLLILISNLVYAGELNSNKIYTVAFSQDTLDNDFRLAQVKEVQKSLSKYPNIRFIYANAQANSALQIKQIEDFIHQKVDLLMASPYNEVTSTQIIETAYKRGIPVILIDRTIAGTKYTSYIHPDNKKIAIAATKYMVKKIKYKGRILLLKGVPTADPTRKRTEGFYEIIKNYPEISVVEYSANYLRRDAIIGVDKLLYDGEKFDAIMSQSDSMLIGARMALQNHKIDPSSIITVGIDYIKPAQDAIRSGLQDSSFVYSLSAKKSAEIAVKILAGEKVPKEIVLDSIQVTKENIDDVKPIF